MASGKITENLSVYGGITYIDSELKDTKLLVPLMAKKSSKRLNFNQMCFLNTLSQALTSLFCQQTFTTQAADYRQCQHSKS
ncbi:MAG: hypothetical protein MR902_07745 [Campylobacter sp.]|nr:hypothetical protein [Campylobacter sp.]